MASPANTPSAYVRHSPHPSIISRQHRASYPDRQCGSKINSATIVCGGTLPGTAQAQARSWKGPAFLSPASAGCHWTRTFAAPERRTQRTTIRADISKSRPPPRFPSRTARKSTGRETGRYQYSGAPLVWQSQLEPSWTEKQSLCCFRGILTELGAWDLEGGGARPACDRHRAPGQLPLRLKSARAVLLVLKTGQRQTTHIRLSPGRAVRVRIPRPG